MTYRPARSQDGRVVFTEPFWSTQTVEGNGGSIAAGLVPAIGLEFDGVTDCVGYRGGSPATVQITSPLPGFSLDVGYDGNMTVTISYTNASVVYLYGSANGGPYSLLGTFALGPTTGSLTVSLASIPSGPFVLRASAIGPVSGPMFSPTVTGSVTNLVYDNDGLLFDFDAVITAAPVAPALAVTDPGFDNAGSWTTIAGANVSGSAANFTGGGALATVYQLTAGGAAYKYYTTLDVASNTGRLYYYNNSYYQITPDGVVGNVDLTVVGNTRFGVAAAAGVTASIRGLSPFESVSILTAPVTVKGPSFTTASYTPTSPSDCPYRSRTTRNGYKTLDFDGTSSKLVDAAAIATTFHQATGFTMFVVFKYAATISQTVLATGGTGVGVILYHTTPSTTTIAVRNDAGTNIAARSFTVAAGIWYRLAVTFSQAGGMDFYLQDAAAVHVASGVCSVNPAQALYLGNRYGAASGFFNGTLAHVSIFKGKLAGASVVARMAALKTKYGL